ncbi:InlB B-repeat-containing protein [Gemmiger formicilis]|uniref:InlB B-repeat-containing protein n=1 Tax=Gemmiger formicilis TaxID=745368 RepID=UPI0021088462|nr:InlB B-repeat-containing protein [Gemmiger formicilis]MCQ5080576.1 InlB B-repeat-containing protein [Gemmiger formicilis]MCQ5116657.1 InlB B-repeat-containing protein [Gemmiger formicilis]
MLALVLALSITPCVFAEEPAAVAGKTIYVDAKKGNDTQEYVGTTSDKAYQTVAAAVAAASSGDTIQLAEGNYTLYNTSINGTPIKKYTEGKDLTFIGAGPENTKWGIGTPTVDQSGEANGDYSFDGAERVTFKKMTLLASVTPDGTKETRNYTGFIRANNTIVENCEINGRTSYWGYQTATFRNTTFNCPNGDYAIWTYCSPVMTFDNCTFNSTGKVINVYTDYSADKFDITVNFNGCTVNDSAPSPKKQVLNINDSNRGNLKYIINISGNNVINGVINADEKTCSRLFGYGGKSDTNNKGKTIVKFGNTIVWQDGKMVDAPTYHNSGVPAEEGVTYNNGVNGSNDSLYAEGYKDNAFAPTYGEWRTNDDGTITRTVTKECKYCKYKEEIKEYQGKLTYDANGGVGTINSATGAAGESVPVAENVFTRDNYTFTGWNTQADGKGTAYEPGASFTLTAENTVLYAQWSKNAPAQVNVSYDANGGTGTMESVTGDVGSEIVIEQNGFARSEYTFTGWNTQADGKGIAYKAGDSFTLTEDTVLYAQWSKNAPAQVKVSYNANGGAGTMESVTGDVGSKIVIQQSGFTRSEYTFTGWNTQADGKGTAYKAGDSFTLTDKDTVLYAQWSKNSVSAGTGTKGTAKPTDIPKTGDNSNLTLWFALLIVSGGAVIATAVISSKKKRSEK